MLLPYVIYSEDQISKIGNTIVYLANKINDLPKTKLLKLIYILDEISIKKSGIPFLNLKYKVWHLGPVVPNLYSEISDGPTIFEKYFTISVNSQGHVRVNSDATFVDDEFSNNDIKLLDYVVDKFGDKNSNELIDYTHRANSPWYNAAKKNNILKKLEDKEIQVTDIDIDFLQLLEYDERKKELYLDYLSCN
jgi:uncharacterized phage-associated protein